MDHRAIIDSHAHFWDRDRFDYAWLDSADARLRGTFLPPDLATVAPAVDGVVFVQADCRPDQALAEARWVSALADAGAPIHAIVAHVSLERSETVGAELEAVSEVDGVVGVRRLLQDEQPGFLLQPDFIDGVRRLAQHGLSFDLCIRQHQLVEATELVRLCPEVSFVLDHLGKPRISETAFGAWATELADLAVLPNVSCKLSGLMTEAPASLRSAVFLTRWLRHAVRVFGAARCMFGSDWPVLTAVSTHDTWLDIVSQSIAALPSSEQQQVMRTTALRFYSRADARDPDRVPTTSTRPGSLSLAE